MGPLHGSTIIEIAGIGPGPFCAMMLADMGADVIRIDRLGDGDIPMPVRLEPQFDIMNRGRRSLALDLKNPSAIAIVLQLCRRADALIEGFRPGVMERLGLGPDACLEANPKLVYGRMTGWGQHGPRSATAGHDINYLALSGVLGMLGRSASPPQPPLNLLADMGGGGLLLAFGIVCGLLESRQSGRGQVIDAAMVEGSALLATMFDGLRAAGIWNDRREANLLDGGAHFYDVYETGDGKYLAVGALEPQFYAQLLEGLGLESADQPVQADARSWPVMKERFRKIFLTRTRHEWMAVFSGTDACVAPVLTPGEAATDPHNRARGSFREIAGVTQPGPAPRFSRTEPGEPSPPPAAGAHTDEILDELGLDAAEIDALRQAGAAG
jgi:alpha-methylacyl-CoA racemase